jgi:hypothetical protein
MSSRPSTPVGVRSSTIVYFSGNLRADEAREDLEAFGSDSERMQTFEVSAAAKLEDAQEALVPCAERAAQELDDAVGNCKLGETLCLVIGVLRRRGTRWS